MPITRKGRRLSRYYFIIDVRGTASTHRILPSLHSHRFQSRFNLDETRASRL